MVDISNGRAIWMHLNGRDVRRSNGMEELAHILEFFYSSVDVCTRTLASFRNLHLRMSVAWC